MLFFLLPGISFVVIHMFDSLRKKLSSFIGHFTSPQQEPAGEEVKGESKPDAPSPTPVASPHAESVASISSHTPSPVKEARGESVLPHPQSHPPQAPQAHVPSVQGKEPREPPLPRVPEKKEPLAGSPSARPSSSEPDHVQPSLRPARSPHAERSVPERDLSPKLGLLAKVKSIVSPQVTLGEQELSPVFDELELALLESDVSPDTTQFLLTDLRKQLVGARVSRSAMSEAVRESVHQSLSRCFSAEAFDLFSFIAAHKAKAQTPVTIMFVGPNGAGKTTTLAKLAKQLTSQGCSSIIAAGDTFRKAAIEQAVIHGERLNVRVVKHEYGADPTAVAFDAVAAAKAGGIDVVLIDTAGRQETNVNLVREMEKMQRVIKPHLKLFVGEAIAGHALVEQAKAFHQAIQLDGVILTKLDCDAKGGMSFSLAHELNVPILFVGTGQGYDDLQPFDPAWLTENVLAA